MTAPYAELDLDGLLAWREWQDRLTEAAIKVAFDFCNELIWTLGGIPPLNLDFLTDLPAAAGLGGAGFPAPVSGIPAPGAPNETRNP